MAEDSINIVKLKISDEDKRVVEKQFQFSNAIFQLTDALVKEIIQDNKMNKLVSCTLSVGVYNVALLITDYSLTKTVCIDSFYNIPSTISILQAQNVGIQVDKQTIDKLQLDCPSILLTECQINQFDAGLKYFSFEEKRTSFFEFDKIDIKECNIHFMQMFNNCKYFNIQRSNIDILNMNGSMQKNAAVMENMSVWQNSNIGTMIMQYAIGEFRLEESSVSKMVAKAGCYFEKDNIQFAAVLDAYNFTKEHFSQIDVGAWNVIAKSASNQGLLDRRAEAQYHIVKKSYEQAKGIQKFFGKLIDFCTGYGYKPIRALRACVLMILFSWGMLESVDIALFRLKNVMPIRSIWDNLFISITAVIGQSGMCLNDGFPYWVSYVEYIGALILFAMFVNALYVRYKN